MNGKRLAVLLLGCFAILFVATSLASAQSTDIIIGSPSCRAMLFNPRYEPDLNAEGITERVADLKIYGTNCFQSGGIINVHFNAVMSVPTTFGFSDVDSYWYSYDSTQKLAIGGVKVEQVSINSTLATNIEFDVETGSNDLSAEIVLENLRFDVTGSTGTHYDMVPDTQHVQAFVSNSSDDVSFVYVINVGRVLKTVSGAGVGEVGWGFEDGVCPFKYGCGYPNKGATTGSLVDQAWWWMQTNPAWKTDFAFRHLGEHAPNYPATVDPDLGPTDLVINVENIMSGVTVTLPDKLIVCGSDGLDSMDSSLRTHKIVEWDWYSGQKSASNGDLVGIYQTVYRDRALSAKLVVGTTNGSPDNGCDATSAIPLVSVKIGNPSGNSPDGTMQAYLRVVMGPATAGQFTGDDQQPTAIPRYLNDIAAADAPTRLIIGDANTSKGADDQSQPYFFLNPTQTVLLFPYVISASSGWETGIEIGNTGLDTPVFGNTGQNGKIDFYFFPGGSTTTNNSFSYTLKAGDGIGLDTAGNLEAGGDFAITLANLLTAAGHPGSFVGYVIAVAHFNFGHGAAMVFSGPNAPAAVPALVLGGRCSYNPLNAPANSTTGAPGWPACSSARQGDITKLPERLLM